MENQNMESLLDKKDYWCCILTLCQIELNILLVEIVDQYNYKNNANILV